MHDFIFTREKASCLTHNMPRLLLGVYFGSVYYIKVFDFTFKFAFDVIEYNDALPSKYCSRKVHNDNFKKSLITSIIWNHSNEIKKYYYK